MDKLVVVGQGYVGLPLAVRAAEVGFQVVGFDMDEFRVKLLASGESFVADVSDERLDAVLASGLYSVTDEPRKCAGFDYAVISVPTPLKDGVPDLSYIEDASTPTRPLRAARIDRRAGVVDVPRHDRGGRRARSSRTARV